MPKVLIYITAKIKWIFLFWGTDSNENRAHVHVGKENTENLCKIWLEPNVEIVYRGDLTNKEANNALSVATLYRNELIKQWRKFKRGERIRIITIK